MKRLSQQSTKGIKGFKSGKDKFSFDSGLSGLGVVKKWVNELTIKK